MESQRPAMQRSTFSQTGPYIRSGKGISLLVMGDLVCPWPGSADEFKLSLNYAHWPCRTAQDGGDGVSNACSASCHDAILSELLASPFIHGADSKDISLLTMSDQGGGCARGQAAQASSCIAPGFVHPVPHSSLRSPLFSMPGCARPVGIPSGCYGLVSG